MKLEDPFKKREYKKRNKREKIIRDHQFHGRENPVWRRASKRKKKENSRVAKR